MAGNDTCKMFAIGRLTRDPECRDTTGKVTYRVAKFSIAINQYVKGQNEDHVTYLECETWENLARTVEQYCGKGKQVAVTGSFRIDQWQDKEGNRRSTPVMKVETLQMLGSADGASKSKAPVKQVANAVAEDEIPF
mgnify:CR=1 FL=1|tara:strand:+ start:300 stop:707 length:408 start_codon:yes stop_codon:yes gene_type:complete